MANLRGIGEGLSVTEGNDDRLTSDGTSFILKMSVGGRNKRIPSRISGGTSDNETKRIVGPTLGVDGDRCCERYCKPTTKAAVTKSFGHPRDVICHPRYCPSWHVWALNQNPCFRYFCATEKLPQGPALVVLGFVIARTACQYGSYRLSVIGSSPGLPGACHVATWLITLKPNHILLLNDS